MKLQPNRDSEPIPFEQEKTIDLNDPLQKWISQFPYDVIGDGPISEIFRCGEKRNEGKEYRRLRVRIELCEWLPFKEE